MFFLLIGKYRRIFLRYCVTSIGLILSLFIIWSWLDQYPPQFYDITCTKISIVPPRRDKDRSTISCGDDITYMFSSISDEYSIYHLVDLSGIITYEQTINKRVRWIRKFETSNGKVFWGQTTFEPFNLNVWLDLISSGIFSLLLALSSGYIIYQTNNEQRYRRLVAKALKVDKYDGPI